MSLTFVFGLEDDAVRFELPCNQECSSLWSPRKMVYRSDWTGVVLPVYPVKMGKKAWELGFWFGVVEIFGNLVGDADNFSIIISKQLFKYITAVYSGKAYGTER
ncbi:hypothetical protein Peur_043213 [Populus x canadensis]